MTEVIMNGGVWILKNTPWSKAPGLVRFKQHNNTNKHDHHNNINNHINNNNDNNDTDSTYRTCRGRRRRGADER